MLRVGRNRVDPERYGTDSVTALWWVHVLPSLFTRSWQWGFHGLSLSCTAALSCFEDAAAIHDIEVCYLSGWAKRKLHLGRTDLSSAFLRSPPPPPAARPTDATSWISEPRRANYYDMSGRDCGVVNRIDLGGLVEQSASSQAPQ